MPLGQLTSLLADIASESPEDLPASSTLSKSPSGFLQVDPLQNPFHRLCEKDVTDMAVSLLIHTWDKARAEGFKVTWSPYAFLSSATPETLMLLLRFRF